MEILKLVELVACLAGSLVGERTISKEKTGEWTKLKGEGVGEGRGKSHLTWHQKSNSAKNLIFHLLTRPPATQARNLQS